MTTAEIVLERAVTHASVGTELDDAVQDLLASCGGSRVAVVRARQKMIQRSEARPGDPSAVRAVELLEEALRRGSWDVS